MKYISGIPTAMTTSSPTAVVSQVNRNGNPKARWSSSAMKNIIKVKTNVLTIIRAQIPVMNFTVIMVMSKATNDWPTPKGFYNFS